MAISKIPGAGVSADTLEAGDIADDAIGTAELANDVTISTSGNIATTGSGTLTVAGTTTMTGDTTHNGNVSIATNKKIKQKGAFMQSSTHQAMVLGG
jgi:hypothetical protein